jgi:PAS domain S-box-containing protein
MKDKSNASPSDILRQKAEDLLSKKAIDTDKRYSDIEILKLVHELDVHQVELEMQNEELLIAKRNAEADAEKYTILYDFAPSGYFTLSKIGEILEVNLRGASLLGKERSFLIDRRFALFISDETRPKFNLFLEEIFDSNTRQTCELKLSIASEFSSYVHLSGIVNEDREECLITIIDISQRIKAEKALKVSEDKYRTLFETNRDSITIFRVDKDNKPGNFIEVNPATTTLFGFTKKELLAMSVKDIEILSDKKRKNRIEALLLNGRVDFETVVKNKKGNLRNVEIETLLINYLNEPAVMNITRDITERKQTERNIIKAQENLATILEAIPDLLFEVDLEGRIYHYQTHHEDLLAVTPSEFMGKLVHEVLPTDAANTIHKAIEEANKKGWSLGNQYSLDVPKSGKHWYDLSVSTIKESSNKDKHFILLARDITERKIAETALNENKQNLQSIFDSVDEAIYVMDESGTFIDVNKGAEKMYHYSRQELIGKSPETVAAPGLNDFDKIQKIIQKVYKTGKPISFEFWAEKKDGSVFPKDVTVNKGMYSGKDALIVTARDITERKKAEEKLKFEQERIRTILEIVGNPIFLKDNDHKITYANSAFYNLFGLDKKNVIGKTLAENVPKNEKEHFYKIDRNVLDTGIPDIREEKLTVKGIEHTVITSKTRFIDASGNKSLVGSVYDITERKKAEDLLQKSQEKLSGIFDLANSGIIVTDVKGKYLLFNNWCLENFGFNRQEMNKLSSKDLTLSDDFKHAEIMFDNLIEGKIDKYQIEKRFIRKDKSIFWGEMAASAIKDKNGKTVNTIGIITDITERKLAEQSLIESKRFAFATLDALSAHIAILDENGYILAINAAWRHFRESNNTPGLDLKPIEGENYLDICETSKGQNSEEALKMAAGIHSVMNREQEEFSLEYPCHSPTEKRWFNARVTRFPGKNDLRIVVAHENITDRKQAELALENEKRRLAVILIGTGAGTWEWNIQTGETIFNERWAEIIGYTLEELVPITIDTWQKYTHPDDLKYSAEILQKVFKGELEYYECEVRMKHKNGNWVWVLDSGKINQWDIEGKPLLMSGAHQDITQRKYAEKAKEDALNLFNKITINVPGVVYQYLLRPDGSSCFPYASEGISEIYRVTPEEVHEDASKAFENIHPDDYEAVVASIQKSAKDLTPWKHEYCVKYKDGVVRYLYGNAKPQKLEDGSVLWHGYIYDITENKIIENSLRESEEKYRGLVENSPDGVVIYKDGTIVFANEEAFRMIGAKNKNSFIGKPVLQFIHPNSIDSISRRMKEVISDNNSTEIVEEKFIRLDGTPFDVEIKAIPTIYDHKEAVQVIVHDITQRKQSALELTKINRVYALISQINNLIIRTHSQKELFEEICNISVAFGKFRMSWIGLVTDDKGIITEAFAGYENGYFTKSNITSIEDVPEGRGPTGIATREARTVICNDIANDEMMKPWRKDALERGYYSLISIPIIVRHKTIGAFNLYSEETNFFTSEEEILLLEKIILNISFALEKIQIEEDRKRTEEKIRQLSQAVEQSPVSIVITNTNGEIEYGNPKFVESTGYSLDEVMGQNPRVLKSGYTSTSEYKNLWQTIAAGKEWHGEFHNKKKDGTLFWESATISPIINAQGKTTHYIAIKEDITHRKLVEKQLIKSKERAEESDRLKLAFLANMSHEIRTPMNGILGFTELLKEPHLTGEEQQEYINIIEKSGKRMLNIINDIISISKVESGQIEISLSETNINEQLEYILTFFKPETKLKGIELLLSKKLAAKDDFTNTDKEKLYAILTNLVKNAIKFTNSGSIEFGCEKKGKYLEFFAKDTGMGISKSQQKLIFERFRQVSDTVSRSHEGSGLGLAISKAYVEMLGGKIWVKSKEGEGSTFYFTIPLNSEFEYEPREKDVAVEVGIGVKEENKIKDLKVLIVEDDAISKLLITIAVKPYSKEIIKVSTGFEAIDACRKNPDIDLVMMDINMPEMGGYEATNLIRKFNKDLVIIAQTANGMQSDRDNAIAAGCTDYISKPININSLGELIQKYFKK